MTRDTGLISFSLIDYFKNFIETMKILGKGTDGLNWNSYEIYGLTYIISLPFTIIGIICSLKSKENINKIFGIWFIVAMLIIPLYTPNINRINIIIIPIIYYTILGIDVITTKFIITSLILGVCYLALFVDFEIEYYITNWSDYNTFNSGIEDVIKYVDALDVDTIYFDYAFKEPYIYVLFYTKKDPSEFYSTVKYREKTMFDRVTSFGKYKFYLPDDIIDTEEKEAYVIPKDIANDYNIDENTWNKRYIGRFLVLEEKV